ncbi:MAG: EpsI family protein [Betaproteobacteria bacterium]|nr:EpsI family protein [Betaproteobacteria bacterium]
MKRIEWKFLLLGAILILSAGAASALKPSRVEQGAARLDLDAIILRSFGDWIVDPNIIPIPPAPDVQANLQRLYAQIVNRTYVNSRGERIMLTVAYGGDQSDALKAHRQEVCYAAQGFEIRDLAHGELRLRGKAVPVTRMLAVRGRRSEPVTYWFTMADRVVLGRLERLLVQLRFGLAGRIPDGMLVRVSSFSTHATPAYNKHEEFINALLGGMPEGGAGRLLGSGSS